jgi:adenylate cyclase
MSMDLRVVRNALRLGSGLVLLAFVVCHLVSHCLLLISLDAADAASGVLMLPWFTWTGAGVLLAALLVHFGNALWSIYTRRTLRLPRWLWAQICLGVLIPILLMVHVYGTAVAATAFDVHNSYRSILIALWVLLPGLGVVQVIAVVTVWVHACIGIHFWLRVKRWYPAWQPALLAVALLLPALALAGFISGGNQVLRAAENPDFVRQSLQDAALTEQKADQLHRLARISVGVYLALVALPFAGRGVRTWRQRRQRPPRLSHASGRSFPILTGATVLETLRDHGVPHAALCGGRARCTTCRVLVNKGLEQLPPASGLEASALDRIGATPQTRLACQIRPTADISIVPLLAADAHATEGRLRGGFEGSERFVTVVFVDIRGSTRLGEAKLPYDVLFILNRFFREMSAAITATGGHYSQFTGDGLMALYGLGAADPEASAADAVRCARDMLARLDELNAHLSADLPEPLRIGIGIHSGEAIVGAMGPPRSQIITAIGDTVNTCARLESLTKDYDCVAVISRRAAVMAGFDVGGRELHEAPVKGRAEPAEFYIFKDMAELSA